MHLLLKPDPALPALLGALVAGKPELLLTEIARDLRHEVFRPGDVPLGRSNGVKRIACTGQNGAPHSGAGDTQTRTSAFP